MFEYSISQPDNDRNISDLNIEGLSYNILSRSPLVIQIHEFISENEINELLEIAPDHSYHRSSVVDEQGLVSFDESRTSSSAMIRKNGTHGIKNLAGRVARITRYAESFQEQFQLVKYRTGEKYNTHYDFFNETAAAQEILYRGQRCITILVYLQEPEAGGATYFPRLNLEIPCKKGSAILWFNTDRGGKTDERTEHGGNPIFSGVKIAMNIWIRDRVYD
jgi:prolyl 4-hydroxylase